MGHVLEKINELREKTNCIISLEFFHADDPQRNVHILDCKTSEGKTCEVNWSWPEDKILKTIADAIKEMKAQPKCFNCKHYRPGFFESCGCNCDNFSKYEDKNKVVTFNEF